MKTNIRIISFLLLICTLIPCFVACNTPNTPGTTTQQGGETTLPEWVDYASLVKFNPNSGRIYQEVTLKLHIDGDTTHFNLSKPIKLGDKNVDVLKARYLGIDTPESTGVIEKWGKTASDFTKERMKNATSIIVESDTETWNTDTTGERHMVWVWYKTAEMTDYRCLNIEILQEGFALFKADDVAYRDPCWDAYMQARTYKKHLHSNDVDPNFFTGSAIEVDTKELAINPEKYLNKKVAFEAIIVKNFSQGLYVQAYSEETGMYHGMYVYYGFNFNERSMLKIGNLLRIVGTVTYWEGGGTYQVSGIKYIAANPNHPDNIKVLAKDQPIEYTLTTPDEFVNRKIEDVLIKGETDDDDTYKTFKYTELALNTAIEMKNLKVTKVYTTQSDTDSNGAMTLTCTADGKTITVRTEVLKDANGNVVTASYFNGKTIDVKGLVAIFDGAYQIKLVSLNDVVVHD